MTPLTDRGPGWHDDPYKLGPVGRDMCLMVVAGAGHYLGGIDSPLRAPPGDATPERRARVIGATIGFLNATVGHGAGTAAAWIGHRAGLACKSRARLLYPGLQGPQHLVLQLIPPATRPGA